MNNRNNRLKQSFRNTVNFLVLTLGSLVFYFSWMIFYRNFYYQNGNYLLFFIFIILFFAFGRLYEVFKFGFKRLSELVFSTSFALFLTDMIIYFIASLIQYRFIDLTGFIVMYVLQLTSLSVFLLLANQVFYYIFSKVKAIVLYQDDYHALYNKIIKYQSDNFEIVKSVKLKNDIGGGQQLEEHIANTECVIMVNLDTSVKEEIVKYCYQNTIEVYDVPNVYSIIMNNAKMTHYIDTPMLKLNSFGPTQIQKLCKRTMDIILSFVASLISSPFWIIVALAIKLEDHGPVLYKQKRMTIYGREFNILKFRSMRVDAEADGVVRMAAENDPRITKVGKVIRKFRLDELPQLWNILKGDMSIVGPRPERPEVQEKICEQFPEFDYRLKVKAGLTGYAQVYGKYNTDLKDKLLLDLMYIESYSITLDLILMLMTVKILFMKESTEGYSDDNNKS